MADLYQEQFSDLIDSILSHLPEGTPRTLREFVADYYAKMPLMDLQQLDASLACKIALNSFEFFKHKSSQLQIRIFRPTEEQHGWKGNYTVIEVHNDDMSFILDSLTAELSRLGFSFYETIHPVLYLKREKDGVFREMAGIDDSGDLPRGVKAESFIHFQVSHLPDGMSNEELIADLTQILSSVELVVSDWRTMSAKTQDVAKRINQVAKYFEAEDIDEVQDFLTWLRDKNFVFLGYIEYNFTDRAGNEGLHVVDGSELGIFKSEDSELKPQGLATLPRELLHFARTPQLIEITKSNRKSAVHRPVLMDYIAIKRFNERGEVIGESRFLGLFTSTVYYQSADRIPFIRRKIARTLMRANFDPMSHSGKSLKAILEFYPRDELFQISEDDLLSFSIGLMSLEAKPDVRLFVRKDQFERFMSCMVYIPRERFSSYLRERITAILESSYKGKVTAFYTQLTDSPLARVHLIVSTTPGHVPEVPPGYLESQVAKITNQWNDSLRTELSKDHDEPETDKLLGAFATAFPESYIQLNDAKDAVSDIAKIQQCVAQDGLAVELYRRKKEAENLFHLKIYTYQSERALSDMLPMLENLGCKVVEVNPFTVAPKWKRSDILIRDFLLQIDPDKGFKLSQSKNGFEEAFERIWMGDVANDAFNALVTYAGLNWREVLVLRAYCQYLRQIGFGYSQSYIAAALTQHPKATRAMVQAFLAKFDPAAGCLTDDSKLRGYLIELDHYLDSVTNISQDRIIRRFIDLIQATLRTNYFQKDAQGTYKHYLSFKFRSSQIPDLPQPVPFAEIFVYSMQTEGIHLRGGPVARGGLRWSDRPEDFRTEVLGLMKAQMVKNAVIVPQGSKGGFIVKNPPPADNRDAFLEAGIACYKEFLRGLLDLTDNIKGGDIVPPADVVRFDKDDPYLVVAADKGTATFSDIANGISREYGFWLDDAFASGGSAGYDHKVMGITARGAWVSVERHFRELGMDIATEDFTVVGIGDMSGDVFGNGMLLSPHIRLLGAFNHKHIFLDPNPDAKKSFAERQRLFDLPRSQWSDYNTKLISKGGGIFPRDQKSIPLSKEVQTMLGVTDSQIAPDILIRYLLKAEVDLLWNGGIGTYVKAESEANEDVGDRTNNALRVNGNELRARVVGEGGNLGFTQRGRVEFARNGGRINTDFIDNSAGVDCSDHEVNIKIGLSDAIAKGLLATDQRDALLESMTDAVGELVLIDNRLQAQALTIAESQSPSQLEAHARMMRALEADGFLDRRVEFLPGDRQLSDLRAAKQGLSRPELAVLLSYSKLALYRELQGSSMVMSDYFIGDLLRYFPDTMQEPYKDAILSHRLRGDIVATIITNSIVNRAGITFAQSLLEETGMHPCDFARAYVISRDAFKLRELWADIEALDGKVDVAVQSGMFVEISHFMERTTLWFLQNCVEPLNIEQIMADFAPAIAIFSECFEEQMSDTLSKAYSQNTQRLMERNVPEPLARRIASLEAMSSACDVVFIANKYKLDVPIAGRIYFELGAMLRLGWLRRCASSILSESYWDRLAVKSLIRELYLQQRRLACKVIENVCDGDVCDLSVTRWVADNQKELKRYELFVNDLKAQEVVDVSMLIVAMQHIESISALEA